MAAIPTPCRDSEPVDFDHVCYVEEKELRHGLNVSSKGLMNYIDVSRFNKHWSIPWNLSPQSSKTRHALYKKLLDNASPEKLQINVRLSYNNKNTVTHVEPSLLRGSFVRQPTSPLNIVRVQSPHLFDEISAIYYSRCHFIIGEERRPELGVPLGFQWLASIPTAVRASIKDIRIITSYDRLMEAPSSFLHLLRDPASAPPFVDIIDIDFHVSSRCERKQVVDEKEHKTELRWAIYISGLAGVTFVLDANIAKESEQRVALTAVKRSLAMMSLPPLEQHAPQKANSDELSGWVFTCTAKRVNFLKILPLEVRMMIFRYLFPGAEVKPPTDGAAPCSQRPPPNPNWTFVPASEASDSRCWSHYFHAKLDWRVSRQFVQDVTTCFYSECHFCFDLTPIGRGRSLLERMEEALSFLRLTGPSLLSHVAHLEFVIEAGEAQNGHLSSMCSTLLRWISEAMNHFSGHPHSSRQVKTVQITRVGRCRFQDAWFVTATAQLANANLKVRHHHYQKKSG